MNEQLVSVETVAWLNELLGKYDSLPKAIITQILTDGQLTSVRAGDNIYWGNTLEGQFFTLDEKMPDVEACKVKEHNDADISGSAYLKAAECAFHSGLVGIGRILFERGKLIEAMSSGAMQTPTVPTS